MSDSGRKNDEEEICKISEEAAISIAECYFDDAYNGRNINFIPRPQEVRIYNAFKHPVASWTVYTFFGILMTLAIFERNSSLPGLEAPFWATVIVELTCIVVFAMRFYHEMLFTRPNVFWRDPKHMSFLAIMCLIVIDVVSYTLTLELCDIDLPRWSRFLRPFLVVNFAESRQIRQGFRNIRRALPSIASALFLLVTSVALFSLMAFKLFGGRVFIVDEKADTRTNSTESEVYFGTYGDSFWRLWVLVTTANSPDVMMPAYDANRGNAIFFIGFLIIHLYMFMSVFLGVVYNQYKANLRREVKENDSLRRQQLIKMAGYLWSEVDTDDAPSFSNLPLEKFYTLLSKFCHTRRIPWHWYIIRKSGLHCPRKATAGRDLENYCRLICDVIAPNTIMREGSLSAQMTNETCSSWREGSANVIIGQQTTTGNNANVDRISTFGTESREGTEIREVTLATHEHHFFSNANGEMAIMHLGQQQQQGKEERGTSIIMPKKREQVKEVILLNGTTMTSKTSLNERTINNDEETTKTNIKRVISMEQCLEAIEVLRLDHLDIARESIIYEVLFPSIYRSYLSKAVRKVVRHQIFRYLFDFLILMNAFFIALDLDGGENLFLALFALEIFLKTYAFGIKNFLRKAWNIFDVWVVGLAVIVSAFHSFEGLSWSTMVLDVLMVLRVLRIVKVFHSIPRFKTILNTLTHILPTVSMYGAIALLLYYVFAIAGAEMFNGLILPKLPFCGNQLALEGSEFALHGYCMNNFNDILSAFVVLFELMVVNQWHVITDGHVAVFEHVHPGWGWTARLFFIVFHIACVIIIVNIFTAFVLEAFVVEFSISQSTNRTKLERKLRMMGLAFGSKYETKFNVKGLVKGDHEKLVEDDILQVEVDPDHDIFYGGEKLETEQPEDTDFKDMSLNTTIRFFLSRRLVPVQTLLEKMFSM